MRAFQVIESEISKTESHIKHFESEKARAAYATDSDALWKGIRAFIWLLLSPLLSILSIIAAIRYLSGNVNAKIARRFIIVSGIVFVSLVAVLLSSFIDGGSLSNSISEGFSLPLSNSEYRLMIGVVNSLYLAPVTLMFIFSIVQYIRETKKKNACQQKEMELGEKISSYQNTFNSLNTELAETKAQAKRLYFEEAAKEQPSRAQMELLANIGLEYAKTWLAQDDIRRGEEIYEQEIQKENPDIENMKEAAYLGSPRACMYYGEKILFDGQEHTEAEKEDIYNRAKPYFKIASDAKIPDGELYCIYLRFYSESFNYDGFKHILKEARAVRNKDLSETAKSMCDSLISDCIYAIDHFYDDSQNSRSNNTNYTSSTSYSHFDAKSYVMSLGLTWYSSDGVRRIKNDPNLTEAQKQEALRYYRIWYD